MFPVPHPDSTPSPPGVQRSASVITRAFAKTEGLDAKACDDPPPDFGYSSAATVNAGFRNEMRGLVFDLFGLDLDAAVVLQSEDEAQAGCQLAVDKFLAKFAQRKVKEFLTCKRLGLRDLTITSSADLEGCLDSIAATSSSALERAAAKIEKALTNQCSGVDLDVALAGKCSGTAANEYGACLVAATDCRVCRAVNEADALTADCDLFDDDLANGSCLPPPLLSTTTTTTTTTTLAVCGDGIVQGSEPCDGGPCCSSTCTPLVLGTVCTADSNVCTTDRCDGAGTCVATPNAASCDDGIFCNGTDTCLAGSCSFHSGDPCTGGGECNDTCDEEAESCALPFGTACTDDANGCTDDRCDGAGNCENAPNDDPCDDGVFCNGADTCDAGSCSIHEGDPCAAGGECNDQCNETAEDCFSLSGVACAADANDCTDDACNGTGACVATPNSDPCDDGSFCNGTDTCSGGSCSVHSGDPCAGGAECADTCNDQADTCFLAAGTACTADTNECTDDVCDGSGSCTHPNNSAPCDDGLFCNGEDTCAAGSCSAHDGDPCAGGGECADTCNETADSCLLPAGTACTDDGNGCTDDVCNSAGKCTHPPNSDPCDDGLFCTSGDLCVNGVCSGQTPTCAAGGDCNDACSESADHCFNPAGSACTDDGDVCTDDVCDGAGTCDHPNNTAPCDDGVFCNGPDTCAAGACTVHAGDPCPGPDGDDDCVETCNEAADACSLNDSDGAACDDGTVLHGHRRLLGRNLRRFGRPPAPASTATTTARSSVTKRPTPARAPTATARPATTDCSAR